MKHSKKILALAMSIAVVASIAAAGTLAYLTSNGSVTNTFNVGEQGNVSIKLDEEDNTKTDGSRTETGNTYDHTVPGATFDKDPTVTVNANSAASWVYMAVQNNMGQSELDKADGSKETVYNATYAIDDAWTAVTEAELASVGFEGNLPADTVIYKHDQVAAATTDTKLDALFDSVTIDSRLTTSPEGTILVKAFAIQAEEVTDTVALKNAADWFAAQTWGTAAQG